MFTLSQLHTAADIVHHVIQPTPQYNWPQLCRSTGCDVWVKHENHTPTTAFKVRGGIHLLNQLTQTKTEPKPKGLISATRGNHGQSLSFACARTGMPLTIVVPECNIPDQNRAIESFGTNLIIHGKDFEAARKHCLALQQEYGYQPVPAFCRDLVIGVASYALEFFSAVGDLDAVYVPIGMGSGIAALITTRDLLGLKTEIIGVVAKEAPTFELSFNAGKIIPTDHCNTIADGVATSAPMEEAFEIIKNGASRVISVTEEEIASAMRQYYQQTHNLAEGAGATPLAGLNKEKELMHGKKIGLILSGGNIDFERFFKLCKNA